MIIPDDHIPLHIHFIWIGSPLPPKYADTLSTFILHNRPNFNFTLWADHPAKVPHIHVRHPGTLTLRNQSLYDHETNIGAKADILRYEIINKFGGIYNDIDAICLKPLDHKVFSRAFLSHTFEPWNNITTAVFGLPSGHPLLRLALDRLSVSDHPEVPHRTGPWFFTNCFLDLVGRGRTWSETCTALCGINLIHQDLLVYPRRTTNKDRRLGYTYHLNDANWTTKEPKPPPRLSLCTAVKNRLFHLSQTLPQNIADAGPDVEFVVLDYTSDDGLANWIKPFVTNGLVNYFRAENQCLWRNSHAKNVSTLASTGEIVCNVDADNFITEGFTDYIIAHYTKHGGVVTAPAATEGVTGRIAMRRADFIAVGGYNEAYSFGWGCEDIDLVARAKALGHNVSYIDLRYLRQIPHDHELRGRFAEIKEIWISNQKSLDIMAETLKARRFIANSGGPWGCCDLTNNYYLGCNTKSAN